MRLAVGRDDDRVRTGRQLPQALGLRDRDSEPFRDLLGRRRRDPPAPATRAVGPREEEHDVVTRREPLEDGGSEGSRRRDRELQRSGPRIGCGRSLASASLRSSGLVRSRIRTPSRWSSSCWSTRAVRPSASILMLLAVGRAGLDDEGVRPLDADDDGGCAERQAALVSNLDGFGSLDHAWIDERSHGLRLVGLVDQDPLEDADLRRREPDTPCLLHQVLHPFGERTEGVVEIGHLVRFHAENRVWVLAYLGERKLAPRLALGVELLVPDLALDLTHGASVYSALGEALRVDVHDRRQVVTAHRGCRGREEPAGLRRHRSRRIRLRQELGPMAVPEPKERGRPEELGVREPFEPGAELLEDGPRPVRRRA